MDFLSTRNKDIRVSGSEAIIRGIAPDGGLFVPEYFPELGDLKDLIKMDYRSLAAHILGLYFDDIKDQLDEITKAAYDSKFPEEVAPLKETDAVFIELYHGKTHAFKDMALSILPYLLKASLKANGNDKKVLILVATSGDTGKAALEGFKDVEGVRAMVFYPKGGVSRIQELQMLTQEGDNVDVFAIKGNFDDAQSAVKEAFTNKAYKDQLLDRGYELSSANSINIGRLVPQIIYYVNAYLRLVEAGKLKEGQEVNICVPTGNFGNILAAYYAREMGLPVKKLIVASNDNKVLTDFFQSGTYDSKRDLLLTSSPSMDILISSNLERLLYHISGGDTEKVGAAMKGLEENKSYDWDLFQEGLFEAGFASEEDITRAIKLAYDKYDYVIDPHTGAGYSVYEAYKEKTGDDTLTLIASTASPFKFPDKVLDSLGISKDPDDFKRLDDLANLMKVSLPKSLSDLKDKDILHEGIIEPGDMKEEVLKALGDGDV